MANKRNNFFFLKKKGTNGLIKSALIRFLFHVRKEIS